MKVGYNSARLTASRKHLLCSSRTSTGIPNDRHSHLELKQLKAEFSELWNKFWFLVQVGVEMLKFNGDFNANRINLVYFHLSAKSWDRLIHHFVALVHFINMPNVKRGTIQLVV